MRPFVDTANVRCVCDKPRRWRRLPTATTSFSSSSSLPRLFAPLLGVRHPLSLEGRPKRHTAGSIVRLVWCPATGLAFNCSSTSTSTSTNYHRCSKAALTSCSTSSGRLVHYELLSDDEKMDLPACLSPHSPPPHVVRVPMCVRVSLAVCVTGRSTSFV